MAEDRLPIAYPLVVEAGYDDGQSVYEALGTPGGSRPEPNRRISHLEKGDRASRRIHVVGELQGSVGSDADIMRMVLDTDYLPRPLPQPLINFWISGLRRVRSS